MLLGSKDKERKSFMSWCGKIDNFLISGERARQEENSIQFCWVEWWIRGIFGAVSLKNVCKDPRLMLVAESFIFRERGKLWSSCHGSGSVFGVWEDDLSSEMNFNLSSELLRHTECQLRERAAVVLRMWKFCVVILDGPMILGIGCGELEFHWWNNMKTFYGE